jgi:hypothetical protein
MKHYLGICLVLVTIAGLTLLVINRCADATSRAVDHVRDAFASVLQVQPKITINSRVIQTQTAPIAELAVVTREELVSLGFDEHKELWSYTLPLTEKKLTVSGTYRIKAGYDLREPFSVTIDPATRQVQATMPPAKILSVEQVGDLSFQGEDSLLDRLTDDERTKAVNDLAAMARSAAEKSTLRTDADTQVRRRLEDLLSHNDDRVEIQWSAGQDKNGTLLPP